MSFWNNIARSTLRDLARAVGVRTSPELAVVDLEARIGSQPDAAFVDDMWFVLRDGWLTRSAPDREATVTGMLAQGRGNTDGLKMSTRAGQLAYLKTLRRGQSLTDVVLPIFLASGATERPEPVFADTPADAAAQQHQFEEVLRARFAAVSSGNINALEVAVLSAVKEGLDVLELPSASPAEDVGRLLPNIFNVFTISFPEADGSPLSEYQRQLVDRIPARFATTDPVAPLIGTIGGVLQSALADTTGNKLSALISISAIFWTALAYGERENTPPEFLKQVMEGQKRFWAKQGETHDATAGLDEELAEILSTIPNVTAPRRDSDGSVGWGVFQGSAVVNIMFRPAQESGPPSVALTSQLVKDVEQSTDLMFVLNAANEQESLVKFFWRDGVVVMAEKIELEELNQRLFRFTLGRFVAVADYYDTVLKDRVGGALSRDDRKAAFDA